MDCIYTRIQSTLGQLNALMQIIVQVLIHKVRLYLRIPRTQFRVNCLFINYLALQRFKFQILNVNI